MGYLWRDKEQKKVSDIENDHITNKKTEMPSFVWLTNFIFLNLSIGLPEGKKISVFLVLWCVHVLP